jgi:hypothetical protein
MSRRCGSGRSEAARSGPRTSSRGCWPRSTSDQPRHPGQPAVITVDTKKKELVGEFSNGGREYHPSGEPTRTKTHDFVDTELGRAAPYGVYDIVHDKGWVSVGNSADTATFAVETIRRWWAAMGQPRFPGANRLLITADAGGSMVTAGDCGRLNWPNWPPRPAWRSPWPTTRPGRRSGTRIEHKMFSFISMNWRGRPLVSYRTLIELISATTTTSGLTIRAEADLNTYRTGTVVTDRELASVPLTPHDFHGDWNYTIAHWDKRIAAATMN